MLCVLCGEYFEFLKYSEYFWDILLCLLCGEGILRIPGEGVIGADRGGTGILPLRIHLLQCILGKCPDATAIYQCMYWEIMWWKAKFKKRQKGRSFVCEMNYHDPGPPTHPPWQGFDQSIGIKGRPIKRAKELIFDQIGFEARYFSSSGGQGHGSSFHTRKISLFVLFSFAFYQMIVDFPVHVQK